MNDFYITWEYLVIYLIPSIISIISLRLVKIQGTDQFYHELIIRAIKNNRNRFIKENPYIIGDNNMAYPQLLHWVLSFFPLKNIARNAIIINLFSTMISAISLFLFVNFILAFPQFDFLENQKKVVLLTGLAYASFPFSYDMINAKNMGISARGIGLFLGQAYLYLISLYLITENLYFLALLIPISILIFFSSAFSMQFILFATPIISALSLNIYIFIPLLLAFFICYGLKPHFFKGQFTHKKLYKLHLAERYILQTRFSIWRDLVYDFWILVFDKKVSMVEKIKYISSNSIVVVVSSMPFAILTLVYFIHNPTFPFLFIPILSCFMVFLLTCFRNTRFLGEPERYLEFCLGYLSIVAALGCMVFPSLYWLLFGYSVLFIALRLFFYVYYSKTNRNVIRRDEVKEIKENLERIIDEKPNNSNNILSNSTQYAKILLNPKWKTFWHPLFQQNVGKYHFVDLFPESYDFISENVIPDLIADFSINYFLCDYTRVESSRKHFIEGLEKKGIVLDNVMTNTDDNNLILYKVCQKS